MPASPLNVSKSCAPRLLSESSLALFKFIYFLNTMNLFWVKIKNKLEREEWCGEH